MYQLYDKIFASENCQNKITSSTVLSLFSTMRVFLMAYKQLILSFRFSYAPVICSSLLSENQYSQSHGTLRLFTTT